MALSNGPGDSTITPPPTPTSPRFTTLPIRSHHTASCAASRKHGLPSLSPTINTSVTVGADGIPPCPAPCPASCNPNMSSSLPSPYLYTSPDGVWENSTPYTIMHEAPIGTGLWSSVYLATPSTAGGGRQSPTSNAQQYMAPTSKATPETPPATPIRRRAQSNSVSSTDSHMTQFSSSTAASTSTTQADPTASGRNRSSSPPAPSAIWAIKAPADRAAFSVIRSEARMLTHIISSSSLTRKGSYSNNNNNNNNESNTASSPSPSLSPSSPADFMVPFLGLDPRSGGLLMQALPLTLDDLIRGDLAAAASPSGGKESGEAARARLVAELFPRLAGRLLAGLQWLHEEAGVVHADVKPSNILLRPRGEGRAEAMIRRRLREAARAEEEVGVGVGVGAGAALGRPSLAVRGGGGGGSGEGGGGGKGDEDVVRIIDFEPLYTDFSAAIPIRPFPPPASSTSTTTNNTIASPPSSPTATTTTIASAPPPHLAGGTWDFLAPELCRIHPAPAPPSPAADVYALGVSLVCVVLGESPFEALAGGNAFRKREMVKCGDAVGFAREVPRGRFGRVKRVMMEGGMWRRGKKKGAKNESGREMEEGGWDCERWLRRGLVKRVEMRAGAGEWREEVEGLVKGVSE